MEKKSHDRINVVKLSTNLKAGQWSCQIYRAIQQRPPVPRLSAPAPDKREPCELHFHNALAATVGSCG